MNKFLGFVNDNSKGINTIVGGVATAAIVGLYVYVGVAIVKAVKADHADVDAEVVETAVEETVEEFEARRNGA